MDLLLFDDAAAHPARVISSTLARVAPAITGTSLCPASDPGRFMHIAPPALSIPSGLRFDPTKALLDPYGRVIVVPDGYSRRTASRYGQNNAIAMKSVVVDPDVYDWEGNAPLRRPFATTVIYEMHVAGFTRHPSSGVAAVAAITTVYFGVSLMRFRKTLASFQ